MDELLRGAAQQGDDQGHTTGPDDGAGHVRDEKTPVRHPERAGQRTDEHTEEGDEATPEHGQSAPAVHQGDGVADALGAEVVRKAAGGDDEQSRPEPMPDDVADRITENGADHGRDRDEPGRERAPEGDERAGNEDGLAGQGHTQALDSHEGEHHQQHRDRRNVLEPLIHGKPPRNAAQRPVALPTELSLGLAVGGRMPRSRLGI
nr:hypothetical protein [Subtercola sp. Z020]